MVMKFCMLQHESTYKYITFQFYKSINKILRNIAKISRKFENAKIKLN